MVICILFGRVPTPRGSDRDRQSNFDVIVRDYVPLSATV